MTQRRSSNSKASSLGKHLKSGGPSPTGTVMSGSNSMGGRNATQPRPGNADRGVTRMESAGGDEESAYGSTYARTVSRGFAPPTRAKSAAPLRGKNYQDSEMSPPASARGRPRSESPGARSMGTPRMSPRSEASTRTGGGADTSSMYSPRGLDRTQSKGVGGWALGSDRNVARRAGVDGKVIEAHPQMLDQKGKWVRHDKESDSRGGCCMRGGVQVKDNLCDEEDAHAIVQNKIKVEMATAGTAVQLCGFTDRYVRKKDGGAVATLFKNAPTYDAKSHKTGCNCPKCKPMHASLMPPAGQVIMVDVGGIGEPPYDLQTQVTGLMPASVGPDVFTNPTCGIPKTAPLQSSDFSGRHWLLKQRLPEEKLKAEQRARDAGVLKDLIPRGCDPPPPQLDVLRRSDDVQAVLIGDAATATEGLRIMRRELGHKRTVGPVPGSRPKEHEPFTYDVNEVIPPPKVRPASALGGLLSGGDKNANSKYGETAEVPYRRMKKAGLCNVSQKPGLTSAACTPCSYSVPVILQSPGGDDDMYHGTPSVQLASPRTSSRHGKGNKHNMGSIEYEAMLQGDGSSAGITKWQLSSPGRHHVNEHRYDSSVMKTCLAHMKNHEVLENRDRRLQSDHHFKHVCQGVEKNFQTHNEVAAHIRKTMHHLKSDSVSSSLQWVTA